MCDLEEENILCRLVQHGSPIEVYNKKVDKTIVYLNNIWRNNMRVRGTNPCFITGVVYADVCVELEAKMQYSQFI